MRNFTFFFVSLFLSVVVLAQEPEITVETTLITAELEPDGYQEVMFTIQNTGFSDLNWSIDLSDKFGPTETVSFTKEIDSDWTIPENQDRINDNVWITRDITQGIFNARFEEGANSDESPVGTYWSFGNVNSVSEEDYADFKTAHGGSASSVVGQSMALKVENDFGDVSRGYGYQYFNVEFSSWSSQGGGGFSYDRTEMDQWLNVNLNSGTVSVEGTQDVYVSIDAGDLVPDLYEGKITIESDGGDPVEILVQLNISASSIIEVSQELIEVNSADGTDQTVSLTIGNAGDSELYYEILPSEYFYRPDGVDWNDPEYQDEISDEVILTRAENQPLFNPAQEDAYEYGVSPKGTLWYDGYTGEAVVEYYTDFREALNGDIGEEIYDGGTVAMYIPEEERYFDFSFEYWNSSYDGAGYSYTRYEQLPPWLSVDEFDDNLDPGETTDLELTFMPYLYSRDRTARISSEIPNGTYNYTLRIYSNDRETPMVEVPIVYHITTNEGSEIGLSSDFNYGNEVIGGSSEIALYVYNNTNEILDVTNVVSTDDQFLVTPSEFTLGPDDDYTIIGTFRPSAAGSQSADIAFYTDDPESPAYVASASGTGIEAPAIEMSSFEFSSTQAGSTIEYQSLAVTNTGGSDLEVSFNSGDNDWVSIGYDKTVYLSAGDGIVLDVMFDSRDVLAGTYTGIVEVTTNIPDDPILEIQASMEVTSDPTPSLTSSVSSVSATVAAGSETATSFVLENTGTFDIEVYLETEGDYAIVDGEEVDVDWFDAYLAYYYRQQESGFIISAGATTTVEVYMDADYLSAGTQSGVITVFSDDPQVPEINIPVTMTVTGDFPDALSFSSESISADYDLSSEAPMETLSITNNWDQDITVSLRYYGDEVTFTKNDSTDPCLEENQDRISSDVWFTRGLGGGALFNAAEESYYDGYSPYGSYWSMGSIFDNDALSDDFESYDYLYSAMGSCIGCYITNGTHSFYLPYENRAFDIEFHSWTSGNEYYEGGAGGFSYTRTEIPMWFMPYLDAYDFTLSAGETLDIDIAFNADKNGTYSEVLEFSADVPVSDYYEIPIDLNVTGGTPYIGDTDSYYELSNDEARYNYAGVDYEFDIEVSNYGGDDLVVSSVTSDNDVLTVSSGDPFTVPAQEYTTFTVVLNSSAATETSGYLTVNSNDPDYPEYDIYWYAYVVDVPSVSLSDTSPIVVDLVGSEEEYREIYITNDGGSTMYFNVYTSIAGTEVSFVKDDFADPSLEANQDRVTDEVWLTTGDSGGFFNAFSEDSFNYNYDFDYDDYYYYYTSESPEGTLWYPYPANYIFRDEIVNGRDLDIIDDYRTTGLSLRSDDDYGYDEYYSFSTMIEAVGADFDLNGETVSMFIPDDYKLYEFEFDYFNVYANYGYDYGYYGYISEYFDLGGGFSYTRREVPTWMFVPYTDECRDCESNDRAMMAARVDDDYDEPGSDYQYYLEEGESISIPVYFSSYNLESGSYVADIVISTDVPGQDDVVINTTLNVTAEAEIYAESAEVSAPIGGNGVFDFYIYNEEVLPVTVSAMSFTSDDITLDVDLPFTIEPYSSVHVEGLFAPLAEVEEAIPVDILSDSDEGSTRTYIYVNGYAGGTLEISPAEDFDATTVPGGYITKTYTLTNNGTESVSWSIGDVLATTDGEANVVHFVRPNNVDGSLSEYQDHVSDNVSLARDDYYGLYNAVTESYYNSSKSPEGTLWRLGPTSEPYSDYGYVPMKSHTDGSFSYYFNGYYTSSMWIPEEDRYFDIEWICWEEGERYNGDIDGNAGGFEYIRREVAHWIDFEGESDARKTAKCSSCSYYGYLEAGASYDLVIAQNAEGLVEGTYTGVITIESDLEDVSTIEIHTSLTIEGTPEVSVTDDNIEFETIFVGESTTETLRIANTGSSDLTISDIVSSDGSFTVSSSSAVIAPNGSEEVDVTFTPSAAGSASGTLTISHDDPANTDDIVVSVTGSAEGLPAINVDATEFSAELLYAQSQDESFTITNTGGSDLEWYFTSDDDISWLAVNRQDGIIGAGESQEINFTFNYYLDAEGEYSADVRIVSNDEENDDPVISVSMTVNGIVSNQIENALINERFTTSTIDLTSAFTDATGDAMTYSAESSDETILTTSVDGSVLTITETGLGTSDVTVSATDGKGSADSQVFSYRINDVPDPDNAIEDVDEALGFGSMTIDLSTVFIDTDDDVVTYTAESSNTDVATVELSGAILTVSNVTYGNATISLTADDGVGGTGEDSFDLSVVVLGIGEGLEGALLYPNPTAGDNINLQLSGEFSGKVQVRILNASGQVISTNRFNKNDELLQKSIDVSNLRTGSYFMEISTSDASYTHQFVRQ